MRVHVDGVAAGREDGLEGGLGGNAETMNGTVIVSPREATEDSGLRRASCGPERC